MLCTLTTVRYAACLRFRRHVALALEMCVCACGFGVAIMLTEHSGVHCALKSPVLGQLLPWCVLGWMHMWV